MHCTLTPRTISVTRPSGYILNSISSRPPPPSLLRRHVEGRADPRQGRGRKAWAGRAAKHATTMATRKFDFSRGISFGDKPATLESHELVSTQKGMRPLSAQDVGLAVWWCDL